MTDDAGSGKPGINSLNAQPNATQPNATLGQVESSVSHVG